MTDAFAARPVGPGPLDVDAVHELLSTTFDLVVGTPRVVRRTRLDTFDGRLARAGCRLQHVTETSDERLELAGPAETLVVGVGPDRPRWPVMAERLPAGPLRDEVSRLAGIRALVVRDEGRRLVRRAELRNGDRKIVARVVFDEPSDGGSAEMPVLVLRPLRGYEKETERAWRLVTTLLESVPDDPAPDAADDVAGRHVDPASPAVDLLSDELLDFLTAIRDNVPGAVDDVDTEFLHDVRVAIRRTRSVLKLGRSVLPDGWRATWEPQFKWLGDLTTPVRDLDVYQLELPEMAGWLVAGTDADLELFAQHLDQRRTAARRVLLRGLRGARMRQLLDEWEDSVRATRAAGGRGLPAVALAREQLLRAHRRVVKGGAAIGPGSPAEDLHVLRKRSKELRYALEAFAPVLDEGDVAKAVGDLKGLQDVLGRFQDSEVQRNTLRVFAEEMVADGAGASTLLAMGELVAHLDREQQQARTEFDAAFARYVRPAGERRMRRLYSGGEARR